MSVWKPRDPTRPDPVRPVHSLAKTPFPFGPKMSVSAVDGLNSFDASSLLWVDGLL